MLHFHLIHNEVSIQKNLMQWRTYTISQIEDELFSKDWLQCYATHILDARYEFTDVKDVIDQLTHLNTQQKADLLQVLMEKAQMFNGTLGIRHISTQKSAFGTRPQCQAGTCKAIPHALHSSVHFQKRLEPSCCTRRAHTAKWKWMGISHFHHTKKRWTILFDQPPLST